MSGVFHAAILFLVAAGLQLVFGVQKIFNLACGSFYALGAYTGVSAVAAFIGAGGPPALFILPLVVAGLAVGAVGLVVERGLLRFVYDRDETFQLLLTFALVLMIEDADPHRRGGPRPSPPAGSTSSTARRGCSARRCPSTTSIVIAASVAIALGIGWLLTRTALRPHHPRHRRQPRDGRGARRGHARASTRASSPWAPRSARSAAPSSSRPPRP